MTSTTAMCRSCGAQPHEGARYCAACGSSLTANAAEYKQVTVLFADVVRSAAIAASVDLERLRDIMTETIKRLVGVVQHYGGTVEYNGDGVMALFGAPVALEDHAVRACLAALAIQDEVRRLAEEVQRRDNVVLRLRVGLNSGQVIAGEIGSGTLGYRATGAAVVLAQRMESAAPPGGVLVSEATAHLVEGATVLSEPEWVHTKDAPEPVLARRLLSMGTRGKPAGRVEAGLVGRRWEMAALEAIVDRAFAGRGGVVRLVGPPGIGKSRVAREAAALAEARGANVFWSFCESHARDIPFHAVTRLLQAASGVIGLEGEAARAKLREQIPGADPHDVVLLDDLLGIPDPDVALPPIDPDARRRRLTAMINTASLKRTEPALFIVEDVHWIDPVSESMLAEFFAVTPNTPSMVLLTSRPEYQGDLSRLSGSQTISLAPLDDSDTAALLNELLGGDPSLGEVSAAIIDRSAGNPFFAEEMVRELAQRGVLTGTRGRYVCPAEFGEVSVPATVQAAIEARIDRLSPRAKRTLNAASVIGERFSDEWLSALETEPAVGELLDADLIDQVWLTSTVVYAFHHPLIRAVAYESQLKSGRAEWHRRLAAAVEQGSPGSVEENAALIARHLESAGDLHEAYGWHMRAGAWSASRDVSAARLSWERARRLADGMPDDDSAKLSMRIAPRTMLCATDFHAPAAREGRGRFAELRQLCTAAGDKVSLAIGMTGQVTELLYAGESAEASRLATEQMVLLESIGDPTLTMGLGFVPFASWYTVGEFEQILRWSQTVIDLSDGDPTKGAGFGFGSPLSAATAFRGVARWWLGHKGWRTDLRDAAAMAQKCDPATLAFIMAWTYALEIAHGVLRADDSALDVIEEAVKAAEASSNDNAVTFAEYSLGVALLYRNNDAARQRGLTLMDQSLDMLRERVPSLVPVTELWVAAQKARDGAQDTFIPAVRRAVDELFRAGRIGYLVAGSAALVEVLLERCGQGDVQEAQQVIERLSAIAGGRHLAILEITLLRLRALLARARGDDSYQTLVDSYRAMAESLEFDGHIEWARSMIGTFDH